MAATTKVPQDLSGNIEFTSCDITEVEVLDRRRREQIDSATSGSLMSGPGLGLSLEFESDAYASYSSRAGAKAMGVVSKASSFNSEELLRTTTCAKLPPVSLAFTRLIGEGDSDEEDDEADDMFLRQGSGSPMRRMMTAPARCVSPVSMQPRPPYFLSAPTRNLSPIRYIRPALALSQPASSQTNSRAGSKALPDNEGQVPAVVANVILKWKQKQQSRTTSEQSVDVMNEAPTSGVKASTPPTSPTVFANKRKPLVEDDAEAYSEEECTWIRPRSQSGSEGSDHDQYIPDGGMFAMQMHDTPTNGCEVKYASQPDIPMSKFPCNPGAPPRLPGGPRQPGFSLTRRGTDPHQRDAERHKWKLFNQDRLSEQDSDITFDSPNLDAPTPPTSRPGSGKKCEPPGRWSPVSPPGEAEQTGKSLPVCLAKRPVQSDPFANGPFQAEQSCKSLPVGLSKRPVASEALKEALFKRAFAGRQSPEVHNQLGAKVPPTNDQDLSSGSVGFSAFSPARRPSL
jgi:hypothetical protein